MLTLKSLTIKNLGRFVDPQKVYFTKLSGLVQVDGQNNTAPGSSSGSGKSTLFNSLDFLLGLNSIPNSTLQSRLTKDKMSVIGEFDLDGKPLTIERSSGKLSIELNGEITKGSNKLAEELLDSILGMPRELFRKLLHKRQKEAGFFNGFTPKEAHSFLTDCLGLSDISKKADKIDQKLKVLYEGKIAISNQIGSNKSSLEATLNAISSVGSLPVQEVDENTLQLLKSSLDKSSLEYHTISGRHKTQKNELELERPQIAVSPFDRSIIVSLENESRSLQKNIKDLETEEQNRVNGVLKQLNSIKINIKELELSISNGLVAQQEAPIIAAEILKIRRQICPTCEQSWQQEAAKIRESQLIKKMEELKVKIDNANNSKESLVLVKLDYRDLEKVSHIIIPVEISLLAEKIKAINNNLQEERQKEQNHNSLQNEQNKVLLNVFANKQAELFKKHTLELSIVENQLGLDQKVYQIAKTKFDSYKDALNRYENTVNKLKSQELSAKNKLKVDSDTLTTIEDNIYTLEEVKRAIKSYANVSFDSALESIGDTATSYIRNIPNMCNATISLSGIREVKSGAVKEEITCIISVDGELDVPLKSLSGGEQSSVDLAVDLAVLDLIETVTGKGCNVLIADEPFGGLDSTNVEQILEMLKSINKNKVLILVDHNDIVKQMVDSKITVIRTGQTSRIVQE